MQVHRKEVQGVHVFELHGSFDSSASLLVEEKFMQGIKDGGSRFVADLQNVDYISSAGLRILLATTKKLRAHGGDLHVCSLSSSAEEVFDISGFSSILRVFASGEEARNAFT